MKFRINIKTFFAIAILFAAVSVMGCTKENLGAKTVVTGGTQIPADAKFVRVVQYDLDGAATPSEAEPIPAQ